MWSSARARSKSPPSRPRPLPQQLLHRPRLRPQPVKRRKKRPRKRRRDERKRRSRRKRNERKHRRGRKRGGRSRKKGASSRRRRVILGTQVKDRSPARSLSLRLRRVRQGRRLRLALDLAPY